jgi:hypothetical protein
MSTQLSAVTLASLITPVTVSAELAAELTIAASVGMPTTAWQTFTPELSILTINANVVSQYSQSVANMALGAYASLAATMVDQNGNPITEWMDLRCQDQYNVTRLPATFASVPNTAVAGLLITNNNAAGASYGPFAIGQALFANSATGAVFTNTSAIPTIPPSGSAVCGAQALLAGSVGTSGLNTITTLVNPQSNIVCTNQSAAVGTNAESNAAYLTRCQAKLGFLSPKGASQAYYFVATSLTDPTQPFYGVYGVPSAPVTRCEIVTVPGIVYVYVANAAGPCSSADVTIVNLAIQALVVPDGQTAIVAAAISSTLNFVYTVYVSTASGYTTTQVEAAISNAVTSYLEIVPIGGFDDSVNGVVPYSALVGTIITAPPTAAGQTTALQFRAVSLTSPAADTALAFNAVPVVGTITPTVVFVSP